MSVYNGQTYVAEAVESILAQTFGEFEFLIIDDGSKDDSPAIVRRYEQKDKRIKFVSRTNKGLTKTLNELFAKSRGEFVARMDCDDVALPQRYALRWRRWAKTLGWFASVGISSSSTAKAGC